MATIIDPPNSVWPNGLKVDSEGYVTFYPLGTNKVDITTITWPDGNELISPFVYQDDKLVGFVDTEALTITDNTLIYLPYEHIEAQFSAIDKGQLQIHAPKATTKKASWKNSEKEDIPEAQFKYKGCETVNDAIVVDANYKTTDIVNGTWSEPLWDLTNGTNMFLECSNLTSFSAGLPSLMYGTFMFQNCTNFTSFSSNLSSLTLGAYMFFNTNLSDFSSELPKLTNGDYMFSDCSQLTSFNSDLPSLTSGNYMFSDCSQLTSFNSDLPSLTYNEGMFSRCSNLASFTSDLSSLTESYNTFEGCHKLSSFSSDLSGLISGQCMFQYCLELTSFSSSLSSLINGGGMFINCAFALFDSDLSSLINGGEMFAGCSKLTSFSSNLPNLMDGTDMFSTCKLDTSSIKNIIDTINLHPQPGMLTLGMGCDNTTEDKDLFAQEAGYADMTSLLAALQAKSWTVRAQYNGRPTSTYSLRRPTEDTLPVFVKLEEVEEEEKRADYTSEDGSKKFRLIWFHETTGSTEGYTQFNSLEEAIETLIIKPIERN